MVLDTKHGLGPLCRELVELQVISVARRNKINTVLRHRPGAAIGNRGESFSGSPSGKDLLQEYYRAGIAYGFLDRRQYEEFPSGPQFFDRSGLAAEFIQDDELALSIGRRA